MKECNLDCALQHEGYCTREDIDCTAKTNADLITEKEYDKIHPVICNYNLRV